jgi:hypothetical protein
MLVKPEDRNVLAVERASISMLCVFDGKFKTDARRRIRSSRPRHLTVDDLLAALEGGHVSIFEPLAFTKSQ